LFERPHNIHIGWGESNPIPGTPDHGWNVFHPKFAANLIDLMERVIVPATSHIVRGSDFLGYLTQYRTSSGWPNWGKALAHIHMGDLEKARELLIPDAAIIRIRFPQLQTPDAWGHNLLELLRLIEEDPAAIPAHCEAVARKSVAVNKLEKFWEPVPFVYDNAG
jgi:hypothetical protein